MSECLVAYVGLTCQVTCVRVGPTVVKWTNGIVTRGSCLLTWSNPVLPHGTLSLLCYFVFYVLLTPNLYPELLSSPSCTQSYLDQISALDLPI
jgi:hypothetical protein